MTKRDLALLERLFAGEMEGRDVQLPKKAAARLEAEGLVKTIEKREVLTQGVTFTFNFHVLTHAGRFAYCESCGDGA